jgi:regulator of RNase E activity RraA
MTETLFNLLQSVDTPTVCNAIEVAQKKRGFDQFTKGTMISSNPDEKPICGYARTAKIAAINPPTEKAEIIKERRLSYYRHMASGSSPSVAVIEDIDFPACIGAFWGEVNTNIHKGLGMSGAFTNGVMRDLGDLPDGFPVLAGSIGPSHGFVHIKEIGTPVTIFALTVTDGDLIHADRHGAVVIPTSVINTLEASIHKLLETEQLILGPAKRDDFDIDTFETAWAAFEAART